MGSQTGGFTPRPGRPEGLPRTTAIKHDAARAGCIMPDGILVSTSGLRNPIANCCGDRSNIGVHFGARNRGVGRLFGRFSEGHLLRSTTKPLRAGRSEMSEETGGRRLGLLRIPAGANSLATQGVFLRGFQTGSVESFGFFGGLLRSSTGQAPSLQKSSSLWPVGYCALWVLCFGPGDEADQGHEDDHDDPHAFPRNCQVGRSVLTPPYSAAPRICVWHLQRQRRYPGRHCSIRCGRSRSNLAYRFGSSGSHRPRRGPSRL